MRTSMLVVVWLVSLFILRFVPLPPDLQQLLASLSF